MKYIIQLLDTSAHLHVGGCPELDVLLTLEQFQQAIPDTLACFLLYGTLIIFETIAVPIADILGVCQQLLSLLTWDPLHGTLLRVCEQVSA